MRRRSRMYAALLVVTLSVPIVLQTLAVRSNGYLAGDFRAFYCAARAASDGEDPYRAASLYQCERAIAPVTFFVRHPGVTVPAPLPGYALAVLVPLARLPFAIAATVWMLVLAGSIALCIIALVNLSGFTLPAIVAAVALSIGMTSFPFGENVPIAIAALCVAAWCASLARWRTAAVAAAIAMIEPQLGLPACLGLFLWTKRSRVVLAVSAVCYAAVSIWLLGVSANAEYFARVLPAQALSEITRDTQYGLSTVVLGLGVPVDAAIRIAEFEYAIAVIAGVIAGGLLARRYGEAAMLVLVPAAFSVAGGTYVYLTQIAAAIPAAMVLLRYAKSQYAILLGSLVLLAVPWLHAPFAFTAFAAPVGVLVWELGGKSIRATFAAAFLAACMLLGFSSAVVASKPQTPPTAARLKIDPDLPQASWSRFVEQSSTNTVLSWAVRVPTFIGLAFFVFAAVTQCGPGLRTEGAHARQDARPQGVTAP